jgi:LPXTG-motif cell wall-anchored protein
LVGGVASIVASMPVHAAVIPNPVTSITTTPPNPQLSDTVRTDVQWCVPDGTKAGDTFEIALPAELVRWPRGFDLRDPSGLLVATASIAGQPATATFTFTDFVNSHVNVCGKAFFESRLASSLVPGTTYVLTYVVNHTKTFTTSITPRANNTPAGRPTARKGGFFDDPNDECRTSATACLGWFIESQVGPFQSVTVNDTAAPGIAFECARVTVLLWSIDASGALLKSFDPTAEGATVAVTCSTTALQVVGSNIPADRLMRVLVRATPQVLDPAGGVRFSNSVTVKHVSLNSTVKVDNVNATRRSALVGGDASGVVPPAAPSPTTTVAPTTTLPAATTTTVLTAALPPVPPTFPPPPAQLPATGANSTLLGAGAITFLAGALLMVVATRRRRPV